MFKIGVLHKPKPALLMKLVSKMFDLLIIQDENVILAYIHNDIQAVDFILIPSY